LLAHQAVPSFLFPFDARDRRARLDYFSPLVTVSLKPGFDADDALSKELLGFARARLGPAVAPKEISFLPQLPRTRSGKIMRRLLKARELGLPEGDTSTLEAGG
jgi:acyl-coenzyme A synthetase/AMP-(fatty) acid ligase